MYVCVYFPPHYIHSSPPNHTHTHLSPLVPRAQPASVSTPWVVSTAPGSNVPFVSVPFPGNERPVCVCVKVMDRWGGGERGSGRERRTQHPGSFMCERRESPAGGAALTICQRRYAYFSLARLPCRGSVSCCSELGSGPWDRALA